MKKMIIFVLVAVVLLWKTAGAQTTMNKEVIIYTSLDQIFSEPILSEFERQTGIKVKAVYDTEAAKTVGLVNRLISEKDNPNADVFWNNEITRTIMLKEKGILAPYNSPSAGDIPEQFKDKDGYWAGFAARARVLIYNTKLLGETDAPQSIFDFTKPEWKGRFSMGNPLFGTTATHAAALFLSLGKEKAMEFFDSLKANGVVMVPGNAMSRDRVADGELPAGFTDTDDAWGAITAGKPVKMVYPDKDGIGTLIIPNTVCLIRNCLHPEEAMKLIDYLLSRQVEEKLAFSESMQIPVRKEVRRPAHVPSFDSISIMEVDFEKAAQQLPDSSRYLQETFLK